MAQTANLALRMAGVTSLALLMTACQSSKDPSKAGFLDGLSNQVDGTYTRQIESKKRERSGLERANQLLDEDISKQRGQAAENAVLLTRARGRLNTVEAEVASLRRKYEGNRSAYKDELKQVSAIEAKIQTEKDRLNDPKADGDDAQLAAETIEELVGIVDSMP